MNFDAISRWVDGFLQHLPDILLAAITVIIFSLIARGIRNKIASSLDKVYSNKTVARLLAVLASVAVVIIGVIIALSILNLNDIVTSILAGAGIIGIALGFAFQDIAANFISGIIIAFQNPFNVGDFVNTNDTEGIVQKVTLRTTEIRTLQGQTIYIPNKDILLNPLTDYSYPPERRIDLELGISYSDDLEKAQKVALQAVRKVEGIKDKKPVDMYYTEFGDSSINFVIRFWITFTKQTDFLSARSEAIKRIKLAFDKNDITIPFPIRTIDINSDSEVLKEKLAD